MARTSTLTELLNEVRITGDYQNSLVFTDAILTSYVNAAIAEVYDLIVSKWQDYYTTETSLATVSGTSTVALPSNFYKLIRLDLLSGGRYSRLLGFEVHDETRLQEATIGYPGTRFRYSLRGGNIVLAPQPDAVHTLRLLYVPYATKLVAGSDTFDGINGYEDLVIQTALLRCDQREDKPTGERMGEIARLSERVRTAADGRDSGTPHLLPDTSAENWD